MSGLLSATLYFSPNVQAHDLRREHDHIIRTSEAATLNISETFVEPTFLLQVLDVGLTHPTRGPIRAASTSTRLLL